VLLKVNYASVISVDGYSYEVGVVGEDYGILLNGDFQLFLVR
jgi:hypothetical protein